MLVLSRKKAESIVISGITDTDGNPANVVVTVVEVRGDKVRIGIDAPKTIGVHRREVFEAIHGPDALTKQAEGATA